MIITINNAHIYAYTAGKPLDASKPTVVFIHGVLNDHSVWILQSRYFAHHGFNVLAIDLPGHGKSGGSCPRSVEEAAGFVWQLLDALKIEKTSLVGHSWGSLIALHAASLAPQRVTKLALLGAAFPMKVSPALLDASLNTPMKAIDMVNTFSHSTLSPPPSALGPGTWLYGGSRALMRRVLASNTRENVFHLGFTACDQYSGAFEALARMESIHSATLFIVGKSDQMTTPKAAQALIDKTPGARVARVNGGHQMMTEAPEETLAALKDFL
jgi:pimeloyl-ACP methyl ester carboxylesterase